MQLRTLAVVLWAYLALAAPLAHGQSKEERALREEYQQALQEGAQERARVSWEFIEALMILFVGVPLGVFATKFAINLLVLPWLSHLRLRSYRRSHQDPRVTLAGRASRLERWGRHARAADLWHALGDLSAAARCYERAGEFLHGADLYLAGGEPLEAARVYGLLDEQGRAARALEGGGDREGAAEAYLLANEPLEAARALEEAGKLSRAAALREGAGQWMMAAKDYQGAGDREGAIRACRGLTGEEAREGAAIIVWAGQPAMAADLLLRGGDRAGAVRAHLDAGQGDQAAALLDPGDDALAGELEAQMATTPQGALVLGRLFERVGQLTRAARAYDQGEAPADAARCARGAGDMYHAGEMLLRLGHRGEAARAFMEAGAYEQAGGLLEQEGHLDEAIQAYARATLFIQAARLAERLGHKERAFGLMQQVPPHDPSYREASRAVARGLAQQGLLEAADLRYKPLTTDPSQAKLGDMLDHAGVLIELHRTPEARGLLVSLVARDASFGNAAELLRSLPS